MAWVGMVMSKSMAWLGIDLVCIFFLVLECCKLKGGKVSVFDIVHKVGEG